MTDTVGARRARRDGGSPLPSSVDTAALATAPALSALESPARFPYTERIVTPHSNEWAIDEALDRLETYRIELGQRVPSPDQERRLEGILEGMYRDSRNRRSYSRGGGTPRRNPGGAL